MDWCKLYKRGYLCMITIKLQKKNKKYCKNKEYSIKNNVRGCWLNKNMMSNMYMGSVPKVEILLRAQII